MRIHFYMSGSEQGKFAASLEAVVMNIDRATKAGTTQACKEIFEESLKQVPRGTGTLASTAFYDVQRRMATKAYTYEGTIGYAGMAGAGRAHDKFNPVTNAMVSSYAARVHEDLDARHLNGGKAKFLEDPVRDYAASRFVRVAKTYWRYGIHMSGKGGASYIPEVK